MTAAVAVVAASAISKRMPYNISEDEGFSTGSNNGRGGGGGCNYAESGDEHLGTLFHRSKLFRTGQEAVGIGVHVEGMQAS